MIDATVRLVGNGYTIELTDTVTGLQRQPGGGGWGLAPVVNSWFEGAGDGARLRGTRRTMRELSLPIKAFGMSRSAVEVELRKLARTVRDPFTVWVDYADGRSYWIDAVYDSGGSGRYGVAPELMADMPLVLKCPDVYWTSATGQSFKVAPAAASDPLLPELAELHVGASTALGTVAINNVGDVDSRPTWTIRGPATSVTVSGPGAQGFTLTKTLLSTDYVTIAYDDGAWTIKDQTGANLYAYLGAAPWFPEFPPGASTITVAMAATGVDSYVQGIYPERREVVY